MKKLSKEQIATRDKIVQELSDAKAALGDAINQFNDTLRDAWEKVQEQIEKYNAVIDDAKAWAEDIASEIQSFIEDKSEAWQQGDRGQAYEEWRSSFETVELEEVELEAPEEIDIDLRDAADALQSLEVEVNV